MKPLTVLFSALLALLLAAVLSSALVGAFYALCAIFPKHAVLKFVGPFAHLLGLAVIGIASSRGAQFFISEVGRKFRRSERVLYTGAFSLFIVGVGAVTVNVGKAMAKAEMARRGIPEFPDHTSLGPWTTRDIAIVFFIAACAVSIPVFGASFIVKAPKPTQLPGS